jgi:hypothetical protein
VILPWLLSLAIAGTGAFTLEGIERAMAVGAFAASAFGALLAVTQLRRVAAFMRTWILDRESALSTFADDRAAAVARQFAWAVDELVSVRAELRRVDALRIQAEELAVTAAESSRQDADALRVAEERLSEVDGHGVDVLKEKLEEADMAFRDEERARRSAEKRARVAEQRVAELTRTLRLIASTVASGADGGSAHSAATGPLSFDWTLEFDGMSRSLRLRCTTPEVRPTNARILDATGHPIAETVGARQRRPAQLVLRIPQSVAAAVESGDWSAFRLEVQVDDVWRGATLVDRGEPAVDEHGRTSDAQETQSAKFRIVS